MRPVLRCPSSNGVPINPCTSPARASPVTSPAFSRPHSNVKYTNNEVYFDVIESVDCIVDGNGTVVTCEVNGDIQSKCWLSGTPDLTMTFTDASIIDDCALHPCVRFNRWSGSG